MWSAKAEQRKKMLFLCGKLWLNVFLLDISLTLIKINLFCSLFISGVFSLLSSFLFSVSPNCKKLRNEHRNKKNGNVTNDRQFVILFRFGFHCRFFFLFSSLSFWMLTLFHRFIIWLFFSSSYLNWFLFFLMNTFSGRCLGVSLTLLGAGEAQFEKMCRKKKFYYVA